MESFMENGVRNGAATSRDDQFDNPLHSRKQAPVTDSVDGSAVSNGRGEPNGKSEESRSTSPVPRFGSIDISQMDEQLNPATSPPATILFEGKSLGFFPADNACRKLCIGVSTSWITEVVIMTCIVANVICLIIQSPMTKLDASTADTLEMIDLFVGIVFTIEMLIRIVAMGFLMGGSAYLRDNWFILDFFVVVSFWLGMIAAAYGGSSGGSSAVRVVRALRPLKLLNSFEELRNIMNAISMAAPYLGTIMGLMLFFFVLFGTMGVALFGGALTRVCETVGDTTCSLGRNNYHHSYIFWDCSAMDEAAQCPSSMNCDAPSICREVPNNPEGPIDGTFRGDENGYIGFDNMFVAFLTIFVITTGDEWTAVSYAIQDSSINVGFLAWPFCVLIVILLSLVTAELFTAVIAFSFDQAGEDDEDDENEQLMIVASAAEVEVPTGPMSNSSEAPSKSDSKKFPFIPGVSPCCQAVVLSVGFEIFITAVIIVNGVAMSLEHFDGDKVVVTPQWIEIAFVVIYSLELLIKVFAIGIVAYVSGPDYGFNLIDGAVVAFGIVGFLVDIRGSGVLRVFRIIFRSMRVLRMARTFKRNRMLTAILKTVFGSFEAMLNLMLFISFSLIISSILGMHMFGFECHADGSGEPLPLDEIPRVSYASFGRGIMASFQIMTGEDWAMIMYAYMHCYGSPVMPALFFCLLFVYTNWVLLAMFVAVILKNFELAEDEKLELQQEKFLQEHPDFEEVNQIALWCGNRSDPPKTFSQSAIGCIPEENGLRKFAVKIVESSIFEWFIIAVIMSSSVALALESPPRQPVTNWFVDVDFDKGGSISDREWSKYEPSVLHVGGLLELPPVNFGTVDADNSSAIEYQEFVAAVQGITIEDTSTFREWLKIFDSVVFSIFWMELILKVIAHGFLLPAKAYLADPWNRLDFLVLMGSTVDVVLRFFFEVKGIGFLILRTFRVLRPLRLIKHNPGMRVIVNTVINCMPMVASVTILVLLVMFIFAVLGVAFFAGKFYSCGSDEVLGKGDCIAAYGPDDWQNPGYSFDNTADALITLFICTTTEGWVDVMQSGMDSVAIGEAPRREEQWFAAPFFMLFMIVGNFFLCQLFVGVLCTYFGQSSGTALLTDSQLKWVQLNMLTLHVMPDTVPEPSQAWRVPVYKLVTNSIFETTISICIGVNVLMMTVEHFPQDADLTAVLEQCNSIFVLIFIVETVLKLTAFGPKEYFSSGWNTFDFIVVLLSVFSFFAKDFSAIQGARSLRVLRVLLLLKSAPSLKTIFTTLVISIPPTMNIMALMGILMFVYGVLGIQLYGGLPLGSRLHHIDNFDNIYSAMMVLFQIATGQDFLGYMNELRTYDCRFLSAFFVSYYILAVHLLLNIFMAALLENFETTFDPDGLEIKTPDVEHFKVTWQKHAPPKSSRMPINRLRDFIDDLDGVWETLRYDPFWFNVLLMELEYDPETIVIDEAETLGFRQTLLAVSALTLSDDCLPLARQVEKAAESARRIRVMSLRLINVGLRAKLIILRIKKQDDLNAQQKMWKIMAVQFARDAMIHLIIRRSKVGTIEQENTEVLLLAQKRNMFSSQGDGFPSDGDGDDGLSGPSGGEEPPELPPLNIVGATFESESSTPRGASRERAPSENASGAVIESES